MMQGRGGFTLIELLVSCLVLMVGLAATVSVTYLGISWADKIKLATQAPNLAAMCLENPQVLTDAGGGKWEGRINGYWVVRELVAGIPDDQAVDYTLNKLVAGSGARAVRMERIVVKVYRSDFDASGQNRPVFTMVQYVNEAGAE